MNYNELYLTIVKYNSIVYTQHVYTICIYTLIYIHIHYNLSCL